MRSAETVSKSWTRLSFYNFTVVGFLAFTAFCTPATAQTFAGQKYLTLLGIPSATAVSKGVGFVGFGITNNRSAVVSSGDGSAIFGFGLGNAEQGIGLQFAANITSLESSFADSGYFSIKASRRIAEGKNPTYASLSVGHLAGWGDANGFDETGTLAVTTFTSIDSQRSGEAYPVMLTIGAGTHIRNNEQDPGVFFGAGVGLTRNLAVSAAWTGDRAHFGAGFKVDGLNNMRFGLAIDDAFNNDNNRRVILTLGVRFDNLFGG